MLCDKMLFDVNCRALSNLGDLDIIAKVGQCSLKASNKFSI